MNFKLIYSTQYHTHLYVYPFTFIISIKTLHVGIMKTGMVERKTKYAYYF